MKTIPNILSGCRILLSALFIVVEPFSPIFWFVYSVCGLTDILDGYIARKYCVTSRIGEILDSVGDFVFVIVVMYICLLNMDLGINRLLVVIFIIVIKFCSLFLGYIRFKEFVSLHTYLNKSIGLLLFICLPLYVIFELEIVLNVFIFIAVIASLEEIVTVGLMKQLNRNIKNIFSLIK